MSKIVKTLILLMFGLWTVSFNVSAQAIDSKDDTIQTIRPVYSSYQLKAGTSHHTDTYLSPLKYSGWTVGFGYQRLQAMKFDPLNWVMQLTIDVDFHRSLSPSHNSTMLFGGVDASWAMMHRWRLPKRFSLGIGPAISLNAGCYYLSRNGNNPASAKAALTLDASAYATWSTRIASLPVTLRYQGQLPVIGAFFSPDYGELYYEIYLGNKSGLAHCGWWGNYLSYTHSLSADLRFGSTSVKIGYEGRYLTSKANNLVTNAITHSAIVGISGEWISINPNRPLSNLTKSISATY